ncbi:MAG: zinc ABC transporter substrate-binding protein [Candidatus Riflebacteria bacterium]|nr:zinc ABC transporter substrate-binding protein [Candidatus Riflebacteria bacterium]
MNKKFLFCLVFLLFSAFECYCSGESATDVSNAENKSKKVIFVSILPQKYLVDRIVEDKFNVEVMVGPGQSMHTFDPVPRQLTLLSKADAYFMAGIPFEKNLVAKLKSIFNIKFFDSRKGIKFLKNEFGHICDSHGHMTDPEHENEHADNQKTPVETSDSLVSKTGHADPVDSADPHYWLDPANAKMISLNVTESLSASFPEFAESFRKNFEILSSELDKLDTEIAAKLLPVKGKSFFVFHPAYGYFAAKYQMNQIPVEFEGKEPSPRQLTDIIRKAKAEKATTIFVQPQFSPRAANTIADTIGASITEIDPLAYNYFDNMKIIAEKLSK